MMCIVVNCNLLCNFILSYIELCHDIYIYICYVIFEFFYIILLCVLLNHDFILHVLFHIMMFILQYIESWLNLFVHGILLYHIISCYV